MATGALLLVFACSSVVAPPLKAQGSREIAAWRGHTPAAWPEDLDYLIEHLRRLHAGPFHSVSETEFQAAVAALRQRIPSMEDDQVVVELARLVTMLGDGHTRVSASAHIRQAPSPLRLRLFPEGLFVIASPRKLERAGAGAWLPSMARVKEVLEAVRDITAADNDVNRREHVVKNTLLPAYLHGLGFVADPAEATFTFEDEAGERLDLVLRPTPRESIRWRFVHQDLEPVPLYLRHPDRTFWHEYMPETRTLYVQVNAVRDGEDQTMEAFYDAVVRRAAADDVECLVLDLRLNPGGNNFLNWPLIYDLIRSGWAEREGRFFTIIGRRTFSAAGHLATVIDFHTETIFVGEPTGAFPNHYGDARPLFLPNTGPPVGASTLYWQNSMPWDDRPWIPPDRATQLTWDDYRSGRDPAMAAILAYEPAPALADRPHDALTERGVDTVRRALEDFLADPMNRWVDIESELNALGYRLLYDDGRVDDAILVFRLNVEQNPESANVYDSLGAGYLEAGEREHALRSYRKALERHPGALLAVEELSAGK